MGGSAKPALFDAHLHIIDPRFPLTPNQGFLPEPFTGDDYLRRCAQLGLEVVGGAVVSGSFQGDDRSYLVAALAELGPAFVGVVQLPTTVSDAELLSLHAAGVRAARVNLYRGPTRDARALDALARRVYDVVGWHVELYADAATLGPLEATLAALPAVSIDHLGLSREGFPTLLRLAANGVHVKATGFGRVDLDLVTALRALYRANPGGLLFGTDLPSTRAPRAFSPGDLELVREALGEDAARAVFLDNACRLYGLTASPDAGNTTAVRR